VKFIGLAVIGLALWAAGPTWAQGESVFLESAPANRLSSRLPGLAVRHLSHRASGPECPENVLKLDFFYPQGFGRPEIDEAVAAVITAEFEERRDDDGPFCDRELCGSASCGLWPVEKTFAVYTPSSDFVSILFTEESYTGGAHGNLDFDVMNFSLKNDRPMVLTDLFPRPEESVPSYWGQIYAEWCRTRGVNFPLHFKTEEKCRPGEVLQPPDEFKEAGDLEALGRLIFTPLGATLLLGPYESGSYASGTQALDLTKEALLEIGGNPALWRD
jgi:hypothetical protein